VKQQGLQGLLATVPAPLHTPLTQFLRQSKPPPVADAVRMCAGNLCDLQQAVDDYMGARLCIGANGFSGVCPFVSEAMLGVCSDQIRASHQLKKVAHVTGISCWPTPDGKAVGALKLELSSGPATSVLGNAGFTTAIGGTAAVVLTIPEKAGVVELRMWYSTALDVSNRTQVGRIYIKTSGSGSKVLDCGDTTLRFEAYDQRLVNNDEEGGEIGSMLVGVVVLSTNITNNQPGSVSAVNWMFLKTVASGGITVSSKVGWVGLESLGWKVVLIAEDAHITHITAYHSYHPGLTPMPQLVVQT
jgi:hypothetical protein